MLCMVEQLQAQSLAAELRAYARNLIFSISASFSLFSFARRFWNQIFTCCSDRFRFSESSALSAIDRYCFRLNFCSRESSCVAENGVLGFLLALCLRKKHFVKSHLNSEYRLNEILLHWK